MYKRIFSLILCLVMCLSLIPVGAYAEEAPADDAALLEEAAHDHEHAAAPEPVNEPAPAAEDPAPAAEDPAPAEEDPAPAEDDSAPAEDEPAAPADEPEAPADEDVSGGEAGEDTAAPAPVVVSVKFSVIPEEALVEVFDLEEKLIEAEEDGSWLLLPGTYYYSVSCEGYTALEKTELIITEGMEPQEVELSLDAIVPDEGDGEEDEPADEPAEGESGGEEPADKPAEGEDGEAAGEPKEGEEDASADGADGTEPEDEALVDEPKEGENGELVKTENPAADNASPCEDGAHVPGYLSPAEYYPCYGGYQDECYTCSVCRMFCTEDGKDFSRTYVPGDGTAHKLVLQEGYYNECSGGYSEDYYKCTVCTRFFADETATIPPTFTEGKGHTPGRYYEPTWTPCYGGYTVEFYECRVCYSACDAEGNPLRYDAYQPGTGAKHTLVYTKGFYNECFGGYKSNHYTCTTCLRRFTSTAATKEAVWTVGNGQHTLGELQPANYTECGGGFKMDYRQCSTCGMGFEDEEGTVVVNSYAPADGAEHNLRFFLANWTPCQGGIKDNFYECQACGYICTEDGSSDNWSSVLYKPGNGTKHELVFREASSTACGYNYDSDHYQCTVCYRSFTDESATTIATGAWGSTPHSLGELQEADYTRCSGGYVEDYRICSVCNLAYDESGSHVVSSYGPQAHIPGTYKYPAVAATRDDIGVKTFSVPRCTECGELLDADGNIMSQEELEALITKYLAFYKTEDILLIDPDTQTDINWDDSSNAYWDVVTGINGGTIPVDLAYPEHATTFTFVAVTRPVQSAEGSVSWSSNNKAVATVTDNGDCSVTVNLTGKPGKAVITAAAKDGSGKKASVTIEVYFINNSAKLTAKLAETTDNFAQPSKSGLQLFDSVQMQVFDSNGNRLYDGLKYRVVSGVDYAEVNEYGQIIAKKAGGTAKIEAYYENDPLNRKAAVSVKTTVLTPMAVGVFPAQGNTAPLPDPFGSEWILPGIYAADANGNLVHAEDPRGVRGVIYAEAGKSSSYIVSTSTFDQNGVGPYFGLMGQYTWKSSNTSVATVKDNGDGTATITVSGKGAGVATISAVSKDKSKMQGDISIHVMDYTPRLDSSKFTLNSYEQNPHTPASTKLYASYGNYITSVYLYEKGDEQPSTRLRPAFFDDGRFFIGAACVIEGNNTISCRLEVTCVNGETYEFPISVTIKNSLPKATVKQTVKVNLSDPNSAGIFYIDAPYEARNISLEGTDYRLEAYFDDSGIPYTNTYKLLADTNNGKDTSGTLKFYLNGYDKEYSVSFKVATVKQPLKFTLSSTSTTLHSADPNPVSQGIWLEQNFPANITDVQIAYAGSSKTAGEAAKLNYGVGQNGYEIFIKDDGRDIKAGSYKFSITPFVDGVAQKPLYHTVKVITALPKLTVSPTSLRLNTAFAGTETAYASYSIKNSGLTAEDISFEQIYNGTYENSDKVELAIEIQGGNYYITAKLKPGVTERKTYSIKLTPSVVGGAALSPITLKVTSYSSKTAPSATVSAKGSLDSTYLFYPELSRITYTLSKLTNITGNVTDIQLEGQDADKFTVINRACDDISAKPCIIIGLKELPNGEKYNPKTSYKIRLSFIIENDYNNPVKTKDITVKVKQSAVKLASTVPTLTLYQSQAKGTTLNFDLRFNSPKKTPVALEYGNTFDFYTSSIQPAIAENWTESVLVWYADQQDNSQTNLFNSVSVQLIFEDPGALTAGKTYTVPVDVYPYTYSDDSKPIKVNLKIKVAK